MMMATDERQQRIAASFTRQYYTLMVQQPERLSEFYTHQALFEHMGQKAEGIEEIEVAVRNLYTLHPNASVKILKLSSVTNDEGNILVTINGTIVVSTTISHNFSHEVELMEHEAHPGNFGIVSDKRESALHKTAPKRWALETPPMFARESPKETMDCIEQPPATTSALPVETSKTENTSGPVLNVSSSASEKVSTAAHAISSSESQAIEDMKKPASTTDAAVSTVSVDAKKPKSFVEAIKMGKRAAAPGQSHTVPVTVVAKGAKEHISEANEKVNTGVSYAVERNGAKPTSRNGVNTKKATAAAASVEGEKKNGRPNGERFTTVALNKETYTKNNNNNNNTNIGRRKDADGRTLSRFVVFYDIIIKGLPADATEQMVRNIIEPVAPVKLIKLLSQTDKKDPSMTRTFSFVQLDHSAIKDAGDDVKEMVAKVLEFCKGKKGPSGQRIQVDEVREKYTAAPAASAASPMATASDATLVETTGEA